MKDELLTVPEAAEYLRLSVNTLSYFRQTNRSPKYGKLGRRIFYRKADLDAWVEEQFEKAAR